MKDSKILEHFFEKQHRQWKQEVYSVFKSARKEQGFLLRRENPDRHKSQTDPREVETENFKE